jgi:hypothetical protein
MISNILTVKQKIEIAEKIISDWSATTSNTYLGIGRVSPWSQNDLSIPIASNSIDNINGVFDRLFAMKKITDSDMAIVIPRIDWSASTVYHAYDNTIDLFTNIDEDQVANGSITLSGLSTTVVGTGTTFTLDFTQGDILEYYNATDNTYGKREIVTIVDDTHLVTNTSFGINLTTSTYYEVYDYTPNYAHPFYVRNSYDQVFKCLSNNYNYSTQTETLSTQMPQITLGGELPQNRFIQTADGYRWKYMYTIPSGLKRKFFTNQWMPVVSDTTVTSSAVDGSIDIIKIIDGGKGYNSNVPTTVAQIVTVNGNGTGANVLASIDSNGKIYDLTIINGGSGYTYATANAYGGLTGSGANLIPVISPHGGNGGNPVYELGGTTFMLCLELNGDESGTIPVVSNDTGGSFDYHQIAIIRNPRLSSNAFAYASNSVYDVSTTITMSPFPSGAFETNDIVYQGISYPGNYYFSASVVASSSAARKVYLNNIRGTFNPRDSLKTVRTNSNYAPTGVIGSDVLQYSGDILYIENRPAIYRAVDQTEQIKLIIQV